MKALTVLIVASKMDPAAERIAEKLIELKGFEQAATGSGVLLRKGNVALKRVDVESFKLTEKDITDFPSGLQAVIVASRHRSETGKPTLTVHWTGNPTSHADLGGEPKRLSLTDPARLRSALATLQEKCRASKLNYTVTLEATHHGPTELAAPTLFVEVGSTEREWRDSEAAVAAGEAIWAAATSPSPGKAAVAFGGGHYPNKFTEAVISDGYALSHILSKYFFHEYDDEIVRMSFQRTYGGCNTALIDWKGIPGSERNKLLDTLREMKVEPVRV